MVKEHRDVPSRLRIEPTISQENTIDRLTLRDQFAISALTGICASGPGRQFTNVLLAKEAYQLADAMLEERKNDSKK